MCLSFSFKLAQLVSSAGKVSNVLTMKYWVSDANHWARQLVFRAQNANASFEKRRHRKVSET